MRRKSETGNPEPGNSRSWKRILLNRWLLLGVGILLVYALLGFFLVPRLATNFLTDFGTNTLKRHITVGEVRVNPFLFTFEAKDFFLTEEDGRPIARFQRLFVDFELSSLFRWAWTFADIHLEKPSLFMEIGKDGQLNLARLADSLPKTEEPPPSEKEDSAPPRLVIQHAAVDDGRFTFSDQSKDTPAQETFSPLSLEFKEISTLPERKGPYTIRADLPEGGTVAWKGEVSLRPLFSEGELNINGFHLATAWQFAQDKLRLKKPEGTINFIVAYRFGYGENAAQLELTDGRFELKDLNLVEKTTGQPLLKLATLAVSGIGFDLKSQRAVIDEFRIADGSAAATVTRQGRLNWQNLVVPTKTSSAPVAAAVEPAPPAPPWRLQANAVKVENIAFSLTDNSRARPLTLAIGNFNLDLAATAAFGSGDSEAILQDLRLKVTGTALSSKGADNPLVKVDTLNLDDGTVDLGERLIKLGRIEIKGGESRVIRDQEGRLQLAEAFVSAAPEAETPVRGGPTEKTSAGTPNWSFHLDHFALGNFSTLVEDRSFNPTITYDFRDISVNASQISNDPKIPVEFDAALKVAQGGNIKLGGQLSPTGTQVSVDINISAFGLTPLQPAVARFSTLKLTSGSFSAAAEFNYEGKEAGPQVRADGSLRLDRLRLNKASNSERLLAWKTLAADSISFSLAPDRLHIGRLRLLEPGAKIIISKDRRLNLAEAIKIPEADAKPETPSASAKNNKQKVFPVRIAAVGVEKGTVDFSDLSLVFPFSTRITDFKGGVVEISSAPGSRAVVKFDGQVDQYGLAMVGGSLSPFAPTEFADLRVLFQNVEMENFSPYSATFAGRKIKSGVLNLDLQYKIKDHQLHGDNAVVLKRFTLGERVKSPDAVSLPFDLAIAILTDSRGVIDLAVPVSGDLNDPRFSYGHVIWQAFFNIITKTVTSPFRALGGLLGSGEEQVDAIAFNPGSAGLLPPEKEKLKKVGQALEKRPKLQLVVLGRYGPESDSLALRTERVKRHLLNEMGEKLDPEEAPGPIAFNHAKTQRSLEKLLERRAGEKAVDKFQADYEKSAGKEVDRVNPGLVLFGVESPDTAFYEALFGELVRLEPLGEEPLRQLARKRAETIAAELLTNVWLDDRRVGVGDTAAAEKPAQEKIAAKLRLDVLPTPPAP